MKAELLRRLRCPKSGLPLTLRADAVSGDEIISGALTSQDGRFSYVISHGIPRFVPPATYADNFGTQWRTFSRTQLDSHSGHPISHDRFLASTNWSPSDLRDQWVLDAGCGAGRFAEVALEAGAHVVAVDLSKAVDACRENLGHHARLHVVQANLYELPFIPEAFSFIYSLGVLQHTPDVEAAFRALPPLLAPGGRLCVDFYPKTWKSVFLPKYLIRPVTKRIPQHTLFSALQTIVPVLLPVSRLLGSIPVVGRVLKLSVPVVTYYGELPLSDAQQREWALLDTFDMLAPKYDNPQSPRTARRWMESAGFHDTEVLDLGLVVARGQRPVGRASDG